MGGVVLVRLVVQILVVKCFRFVNFRGLFDLGCGDLFEVSLIVPFVIFFWLLYWIGKGFLWVRILFCTLVS